MSSKTQLTELENINKHLDKEIERVSQLRDEFEIWSNEKRTTFNKNRIEQLWSGDIHIEDLRRVIKIMENFDAESEENKQYVIDTFHHLSQSNKNKE